MKISARCLALASLVLAALASMAIAPAGAVALNVSFDTSALAGQTGTLAFDFIDGDAVVGGLGNTASISAFSSATALQPGATTTGGVSGTLAPGPLTLSDQVFFNELLQPVMLGGLFNFTVNVTENLNTTTPPSTVPDQFSLALLDASGNALPTSDPNGTNLLALAGADGSAAQFALTVQAVPEPVTPALCVAGVIGFLGARWLRRRPVRVDQDIAALVPSE
jgi:hypothetical protein